MYKTLRVAVLLIATFAFTSGSRSADASPTTPPSPVIVARAKLVNQTSPIPTTTIFTPTQNGLYRLSVYATVTRTGSVATGWQYDIFWTDDSGPQNGGQGLINGSDGNTGSFTWTNAGNYGAVLVLEAAAGTPITYDILQQGAPDNAAYSLYYTLERLE